VKTHRDGFHQKCVTEVRNVTMACLHFSVDAIILEYDAASLGVWVLIFRRVVASSRQRR